jgi:hypothetical protein
MLKENSRVLVEPWHATPEQRKAIQATKTTSEWLCRLPSDILRQYRDQWIAAKDCRIVASGPTMEELAANLGDTDMEAVVVACLRPPFQVIYK